MTGLFLCGAVLKYSAAGAGVVLDIDVWVLKLRAGYITDLENSKNNTTTLGLYLLGLNLAVQQNNSSLSGYIGGNITF